MTTQNGQPAITSKAQHIAEAERVLDNLRDLITRCTTVGVPMEAIPAAGAVIGYAQAHAALAAAYGGTVEAADVAQARAKLADPPAPAANGSRLLVPQLAAMGPDARRAQGL